MQINSAHGVFPDFLSCSFARDHFPESEIRDLLLDLDFRVAKGFDDGFRAPDGHGLVRFHKRDRSTVVTFSGGAVGQFIRMSAVGNLLQVLTLENCRVTRLDLAQDTEFDNSSDVSRRLQTVCRRGWAGRVALGRKSVSEKKVKPIWGKRDDAAISGTVYFGSRKDRYHAKIYDKRMQMAEVHDIDIMRELVRVEVTASRGTATLRDFLEPDALFFHLASPDLVACPRGVANWEIRKMDAFKLPPVVELTDHERMIRLIESSPDLETLRLLCARCPAEVPLLLRKLEAKLRGRTVRAA
jgi:hypothetical protein